MDQKAYLVSWHEDESEFVVMARTPEDAKRQFLANREAAGALDDMRQEASDYGISPVEDGVHAEELTSPYGHGVFSLDGEI